MFFRFSGVHLTQAFPSRQPGGVCVADVQFVAVVLATHATTRIQSANYGSCLGPVTADDDGDLDLLSGLCGTPGSTRISGVVADTRGRGAPKNLGQDTTTSSRPNASARSRSLSLATGYSSKVQSKMYRPLDQAKGGAFFCRANLFTLASRESSIRVTEDPPFCPIRCSLHQNLSLGLLSSNRPLPPPLMSELQRWLGSG